MGRVPESLFCYFLPIPNVLYLTAVWSGRPGPVPPFHTATKCGSRSETAGGGGARMLQSGRSGRGHGREERGVRGNLLDVQVRRMSGDKLQTFQCSKRLRKS